MVGERPQALLAALRSGGHRARRAARGRGLGATTCRRTRRRRCRSWSPAPVRRADRTAVVRDGDGYRLGVSSERGRRARRARPDRRPRARRSRPTRPRGGPARRRGARGRTRAGRSRWTTTGRPRRRTPGRRRRTSRHARRVLAQASSRSRVPRRGTAACSRRRSPAGPTTRLSSSTCCAASRRCAGPPRPWTATRQHRAGLRERLGTDPGPGAPAAAPGAAVAGQHRSATACTTRRRRCSGAATTSAGCAPRWWRRGWSRSSGPADSARPGSPTSLGRTAVQPVVHFVELVGVTRARGPGRRGRVCARRARLGERPPDLTPEQRADVRARIAQHLDQAPSLLILDNCEHIVDAVADLVAYLVATTRELRVLTTTRAPLAIAAERVLPARRARCRGRRGAVRASARSRPGRTWCSPVPSARSRRSSSDSTVCRWRSSWQPRRSG